MKTDEPSLPTMTCGSRMCLPLSYNFSQ